MQENYQNLAPVYDQLQQEIDTKAWADYIQALESRFGQREKPGDGQGGRPLLLDLGCGTGSFCLEMLNRGYDPIGIDASAMMLEQARQKETRQKAACTGGDSPPILFLQQDISRFELYGTVDLIVCLLDTINHLVRPEQVKRLFGLCANYLNPGGLFIFDLASQRHLARTLGNRLFFQDTDQFTLFWQNGYRPQSGISRSELTLFCLEGDGSYARHDETIVEKYYSPNQIRQWLRSSGLEPAARYGDLAMRQPARTDERHFYISRKPAKSGKTIKDVIQ